MSDGDIKRYKAAELNRMAERGGTRTDLARVRALSDAEVERSIADDADEACIPVGALDRAQAVMPGATILVSLRLDPAVVEYFRSTGPGWQARINELLRAHQEAAASPAPDGTARLRAGQPGS